ncbi:metastasis-associated in colon cancer protein 1 [Engraulis encrasicolus]|uniref:metastasis-associated in colon cancer protein 1 n=1 Tax=Engraulis encrasicolus TaxID=184585 RepID=UPI002FD5D3D6
MAAARTKSFHRTGSLMRSRSEGTLIDLDDGVTINNNIYGSNISSDLIKHHEWPILQPEVQHPDKQATNPFWKELSASNPFLDDIVLSNNNLPIVKEDPSGLFSGDLEDSASISSDENDFSHILRPKRNSFKQAAKWRSASDILDGLENKQPKRENSNLSSSGGPDFLNPDFEWLKNDREAYKMAWLSHRQLTRSCLDLGMMSQSPGWAQTQAADTHIICKIGHSGGSVQLPDSDISVHIPQGNVSPGDVQEIALKTSLDPPKGLNSNYVTTVSPLLELSLSSLNLKGDILLEMKVAAEVKKDTISQVMTSFVGFIAHKKEGPYQKVSECQIRENMLQMKLNNLKPHLYIVAAAEASVLQPPATSVWDYLNRQVTVAFYGPKHIHPSFKAIMLISCHNKVPIRLPYSDVRRGIKNLPPLVLQLWGKHECSLDELKDMCIKTDVAEAEFVVKAADQNKEVKQDLLRQGRVVHLPLEVLKSGKSELRPFALNIRLQSLEGETVVDFTINSPPATPVRHEKQGKRRVEKQREAVHSATIPEDIVPETTPFQQRTVNVQSYGVALKSVLRQPRVEYLLEYFKGDTVALLSSEKVRSVGQSKVKEWYIGFLRGRVGLVHCKNVKLITRQQVIDFSGIKVTTQNLLDNMTLPFKKLTYMYSSIETLVTEHITSWRTFAKALGYSEETLETTIRRHAETEPEKVACVLEKLKEDCHTDKHRMKFQYELMSGLLKMDAQGLIAHLIQNTVILSTAVELGVRWRELAERLGRLSSAQIAAYEMPHRGKSGEVSAQSMWKPAYDFLHLWSLRYGEGYRDMIQDLHLALDKMKTPVTREWRQITGALITVNCMEILRAAAFTKQ